MYLGHTYLGASEDVSWQRQLDEITLLLRGAESFLPGNLTPQLVLRWNEPHREAKR